MSEIICFNFSNKFEKILRFVFFYLSYNSFFVNYGDVLIIIHDDWLNINKRARVRFESFFWSQNRRISRGLELKK